MNDEKFKSSGNCYIAHYRRYYVVKKHLQNVKRLSDVSGHYTMFS